MAEGGPSYITWNIPNWITVVLMVSLGAVLLGVVASGLATWQQNSGA